MSDTILTVIISGSLLVVSGFAQELIHYFKDKNKNKTDLEKMNAQNNFEKEKIELEHKNKQYFFEKERALKVIVEYFSSRRKIINIRRNDYYCEENDSIAENNSLKILNEYPDSLDNILGLSDYMHDHVIDFEKKLKLLNQNSINMVEDKLDELSMYFYGNYKSFIT